MLTYRKISLVLVLGIAAGAIGIPSANAQGLYGERLSIAADGHVELTAASTKKRQTTLGSVSV